MTSLRHYIGTNSTRSETISATPLRLLAATLNLQAFQPEPGAPVPPLWHWLYFLPDDRLEDLAEDGHPQRGDFYPAGLPRRRMFGGATITLHQPLRVGETAVCRTEIVGIDERDGESGPLVLLRLLRQIDAEAGLAVTEFQTLLYTDSAPGPAATDDAETPGAEWEAEVEPDSRMLFRFSALTFNTHRIHYDLPYATEVEGYPGLVVHGPLTALLLAELARAKGLEIVHFEFRARAPVFAGDAVQLRGTPTPEGATLAAYRGGEAVMKATATGSRARSV